MSRARAVNAAFDRNASIKIPVLFTGAVILALIFSSAAGVAGSIAWPECPADTALTGNPDLRNKLLVKACGPTRVKRGRNYSYTIVVTNVSRKMYRRVRIGVFHYDPITKSSIPYRGVATDSWAVWRVRPLKSGHYFRVGIRLPFFKHNDPKGSNFTIEAEAVGTKQRNGLTRDVYFVP